MIIIKGKYYTFFFLFGHVAWHVGYGILVPQPGIEPTPLAVEVRSLNHWTVREVPILHFFFSIFF